MMGRIPRSERSKGWRLPLAFLHRWLNVVARHVPMLPAMRVGLHRVRGVKIGRGVFIGAEVFIDDAEPHRVVIEDDVTLIARSALLAHGYYPQHMSERLSAAGRRSGVVVRRGAYVGFGSIVLPGVTIGERAVIGAGVVVARDVPAEATVVGAAPRRLDPGPGDDAGDRQGGADA